MLESKLALSVSLLLSLNGIIVVFSILVILALATIIIARIIRTFEKKKVPQSPAPTLTPTHTPLVALSSTPSEEELGDIVAVLQGALSMESGIPVDQFEIVSVRSASGPKL